jgi:oligopeptide/dipeptide ABC transporter ATP-binding protein
VSDRVAIMYLGKVVELAPVEDMFQTARHPYAKALISAVPIPDPLEAQKRVRILLVGDVPSPIHPPSGCRFHTRCPKAKQRCVDEEPALLAQMGDPPEHAVACHFPVQVGEDLTLARPTIAIEDRVGPTYWLTNDP